MHRSVRDLPSVYKMKYPVHRPAVFNDPNDANGHILIFCTELFKGDIQYFHFSTEDEKLTPKNIPFYVFPQKFDEGIDVHEGDRVIKFFKWLPQCQMLAVGSSKLVKGGLRTFEPKIADHRFTNV